MMEIKRRITKSYFELAIVRYAPLVQKLSSSIGTNCHQIEELKVRADAELLKCMICYVRGGSFITFLYSRLSGIFRHVRDAENRAKRIKNIPVDFMDDIPGKYVNICSGMMVQELLECLDTVEHTVIMELFFNGKTMRDISYDHGIAASTICRIKKRAINKMKQKNTVRQG